MGVCLRILLTLGLVSLLSCAAEEPEEIASRQAAIINGELCGDAEHPATVALIIDTTLSFGEETMRLKSLWCTGTLIAPDVVLTAAHCINPFFLDAGLEVEELSYYVSSTADLRYLTDGDPEAAIPQDAVRVRAVVHQESFSNDGIEEGLGNYADIGVVFLNAPITGVSPAIVMTPEEAQSLAAGDEVRISGWGRQGAEDSAASGTKHCGTATISELGDFEMRVGGDPETTRKCHGDSGGPSFVTVDSDTRRSERVIGITSRAYDESDCHSGGIDTLASAWYDWLDETMSARCEADERVWCDVPGVIDPTFYDKQEPGGCGVGGTSGGLLALGPFLLYLGRLRRRQRA